VSEVPVVSGVADLVSQAFSPDGALARAIPDFEPRDGQVEMAGAIARVLEKGGVLLAEAGTGTGKTLAYLAPAVLSRQRVLISTGTKNLQEQIFGKDIPALRDALGVPFTATCMKGRANYVCLHRLDQLMAAGPDPELPGVREPRDARGRAPRPFGHPVARSLGVDVFLPMISEWSTRTDTGDRAELVDLPEDFPFWNDVSATAETCLGSACPRYDDCFVTRMRQRAAAADIVIVNHHLLCADAAVRQRAFGEVIPGCSHVVLDEAHMLEDVATQYFGYGVSNHRVEELARDIDVLLSTGAIADDRDAVDLARNVGRLRDSARAFFAELSLAHRAEEPVRGEQRVRVTASSLTGSVEAATHLTGSLDVLAAGLALADPRGPASDATDPRERNSRTGETLDREPRNGGDRPDGTDPDAAGSAVQEDLATLVRRAGELRDDLRFLLRASEPEYVYFVEFRGRGVFLRASPIDVSAMLRRFLFDRMRTLVLTSATLAVDGTFEYVRARLGIGSADEIRLRSEFDFARQAILYLPPRMPDPRSSEFSVAAGRQVVEILARTRGRAFVLFTSYTTMKAVQAVAEMALRFPIFTQGTAPRSMLLKQFRETPNSVLFATSSFWQGVDVVGDALSCVIIDKLPFASPAEPITAARIDAIRANGGEPFNEFQVPLAILTLRQGLGRLIRHRSDRGVLAVLDPRLQTKAYGRRFVASLPPARVVRELGAIDAFFTPRERA
jgi:ATP-dependent DNA helicase DinG